MTAAWIAQLIVDIGFVALAFTWWKQRREKPVPAETSTILPPNLDEKIQMIDGQMEEYRKRMNAQLLALADICKEAKGILDRGQLRVNAFSPSEEERELRERSAPQIPTLQEVEKSRGRLKNEVILDLKTLLKDQLA